MKRLIVAICLILILILGNKLREYEYAKVPFPGETADEYSFGWLGLSLIQDGYPVAWSGIGAYKDTQYKKINVDGIYNNHPEKPAFAIDKPWFDHPPLFGIISGGYAYLKGVREFEDASVIILRRPMLKIAILTSLLIFLLGRKLFDDKAALLSTLIYSISPVMLISSRLSLAENGYLPLFLGAILGSVYFIKSGNRFYWYLACGLGFLAILMKLSAIAVSVALIVIAIQYGKNQKKWMIGSVFVSLVMALLIFGLYGAYYDWSTFIKVWVTNSNRIYGSGAEIFYSVITKPFVATRNLTDGWITAGFISVLILSSKLRKINFGANLITICVFSYLVTFLLFGSEGYGWYRFPFYPFIAISLAKIILFLIENDNVMVFLSLMLLPFGTSVHRLIGVEGFGQYVTSFRIFILVSLIFFIFNIYQKNAILFKVFSYLVIGFVVWISIQEIYKYNFAEWIFVT